MCHLFFLFKKYIFLKNTLEWFQQFEYTSIMSKDIYYEHAFNFWI